MQIYNENSDIESKINEKSVNIKDDNNISQSQQQEDQ